MFKMWRWWLILIIHNHPKITSIVLVGLVVCKRVHPMHFSQRATWDTPPNWYQCCKKQTSQSVNSCLKWPNWHQTQLQMLRRGIMKMQSLSKSRSSCTTKIIINTTTVSQWKMNASIDDSTAAHLTINIAINTAMVTGTDWCSSICLPLVTPKVEATFSTPWLINKLIIMKRCPFYLCAISIELIVVTNK